jgi:conjugal transfer pilus assembly protein TraA
MRAVRHWAFSLTQHTKLMVVFMATCVASLLMPHLALAGTDATFASLFTTLSGWATGSLGEVIAVCIFLVGMGIGIVRQSLMAIALAIGAALALVYTPDIMTTLFTAII